MNSKSILQIGKIFTILSLVALTFFSCQDEPIDAITLDESEAITANSDLAVLMQLTASLDGSLDNILDNANCITINLPVTVIVNGVEIIIDSESDYELIEAVFDEFSTDEDNIEIVFPIVIVLNDYTTVEISNQDELETFIDECLGENEEDDDIECIDFQYPIVFSIIDANFQVIETVIIENDEALYSFIENLEGGTLVSLNFPVTMVLSDGSTVEVNNNQELEVIISEAEDDCDEDDDNDWNDDDILCSQEDVEAYLLGCSQVLTLNEYTPGFTTFSFSENNVLSTLFENDQPASGTWDIVSNDDGVFVVIDFSVPTFSFLENISGTWKEVECTENYLILENGDDVLIIESVCENPCYSGTAELVVCDDNTDGIATFNLITAFNNCDFSTVLFYETAADAENGINPLASPETYTNIVNPQTIYVPIPAPFGAVTLYEIDLIVENCTSNCSEEQLLNYLYNCDRVVSVYNGSDAYSYWSLTFLDNGTFTYTNTQTNETFTADYILVYDNGNLLMEFSNILNGDIQIITGSWIVNYCDTINTEFLSASNNQDAFTMMMDCSNDDGICSENEVDNILMECEWQIALYNGSAGFNIFYIDFMDAQSMTITSASESYTGNWTSSQDGDYVYVEFSNISGGNVQVFNGINFKVVECTTEQMILHDVTDSNNELVLDRYCN